MIAKLGRALFCAENARMQARLLNDLAGYERASKAARIIRHKLASVRS